MRTNIFKKTLTMILAFAMVLTMMPLSGVGVQKAYAATGSGGEVASNDADAAKAAFGSGNVDAGYSNQTLTITVKNDITLSGPVVFKKGVSGDTVVLDLMGHTITGKAGTGTSKADAAGSTAIEISAADFNVEIKGSGTVKGGTGVKYETSDHMYYGGSGGMAVAFTDSSWKPTADNGKLTYGLTVTDDAALQGGDGADLTGEDWLYNIEHYDGEKRCSYISYDDIMFTLRPGRGGAGIGQTGANVSEGISDRAYASIIVENGEVTGGCGGKVDLDTTNMPVLTNYALMHNSTIKNFLDEVKGAGSYNDQYSNYVTNQIKFLPGNGGDGIVIGDGRKFVYVAQSGYVQGGSSGNFDYGQSKYVNQFNSIGAGTVATAGNGISVYGDVGLTNISPTDKTVTSGNASSRTGDSDEMGIFIAGTVRGGYSPDASAMNEYSGDAGEGISIDGLYGRENWGIIEVGQGGTLQGGDAGSAAYGSLGTPGEALRERRPKGQDSHDTRFGTDFLIVNGAAKGGNGGNSWGVTPAGSGASGMTFDTYRKNLRIYGDGTVAGGDCGTETDHGQSTSIYRPEGIHMGNDSSNIVNVSKVKGNAASKVNVDKLNISAAMSNFDNNPTTSTRLSLDGIPVGYTGGVFIRWYATIYETSSSGSVSYNIESAGTDLKSFNMLSNDSYGDYLAYPTYPAHISIQLDMNNYNADVATTNRMREDGKYQTDIYCYVVLADGRWGKSPVMRYEKNRGWNGTGYLPDDDGGDEPAPDPDMDYVLSVGQAIKDLPDPGSVKASDNAAIVSAYDNYINLTDDQKEKYLFDYDYAAKIDACAEALYAIIDGGVLAGDDVLLSNINDRLDSLPDDVSEYTLANNEADVRAAQAAYNNLRDKTKLPVEQYTKLDNAVTKIDALREAADADYCLHNIVIVNSKPSTCHEKGNITYYKCTGCDRYFSDSNGEHQIENKEDVELPIDENAHEFEEWKDITNPTCTVVGTRERKCKYHSNVVETEDISVDAEAHTWGAWTTKTAPTCSRPGVERRECSSCGSEETRIVNALEHEWGAWVVTVEGTCTQDGFRKHECTKCHTEETEVIPAGHSWTSWTSKKPTEEAEGVETHKCSRCGSTYNTAIAAIKLPTDLPAVKISKLQAGKKKVTVKWKKPKKKVLDKIQGYEIRVVGQGKDITKRPGKKSTSKKIGGLKSKKKYKVMLRTYKYIGNVKHVSKWKSKTVRVK